MTLEAILASLHLVAFLTLVVFMSSQAALCRPEWLNEAVVKRLVKLGALVAVVLLLVLLTGVARVVWGVKGGAWYGGQPLFHVKTTLFLLVVVLAIRPLFIFRRWHAQLQAGAGLPAASEIKAARRWVMGAAHLVPVIAVVAVFWARGW
jgi:putative membrane protein